MHTASGGQRAHCHQRIGQQPYREPKQLLRIRLRNVSAARTHHLPDIAMNGDGKEIPLQGVPKAHALSCGRQGTTETGSKAGRQISVFRQNESIL